MLKVLMKRSGHIELYGTTDDIEKARKWRDNLRDDQTASWIIDENNNYKLVR